MQKLIRRMIPFLVLALLTGCAPKPQQPEQMPTPTVTEPTIQTIPTEPTIVTEPTEAETEPTEPPRPTIDTIPKYYQTDYPNIKFGNGTISSSGCSVTCLAMVATYLTDFVYTPVDMARAVRRVGKTHVERLEYGNELLALPNEKSEDWNVTYQALKDGKVVVAMMAGNSVFTNTAHFVVFAGLTEDGRVIVNDPNEHINDGTEYNRKGYANGFSPAELSGTISGAWIYDKATMPEDYQLYQPERPETPQTRYTGYELDDEDYYMLACFVWAVAKDEPEDVQQAVVEVVLNRVLSPDWPNTVPEVLKKGEWYKHQKAMKYAEPEALHYYAVEAAMYEDCVVPMDVFYFDQWTKKGDDWGKLGSFTFRYSR